MVLIDLFIRSDISLIDMRGFSRIKFNISSDVIGAVIGAIGAVIGAIGAVISFFTEYNSTIIPPNTSLISGSGNPASLHASIIFCKILCNNIILSDEQISRVMFFGLFVIV